MFEQRDVASNERIAMFELSKLSTALESEAIPCLKLF